MVDTEIGIDRTAAFAIAGPGVVGVGAAKKAWFEIVALAGERQGGEVELLLLGLIFPAVLDGVAERLVQIESEFFSTAALFENGCRSGIRRFIGVNREARGAAEDIIFDLLQNSVNVFIGLFLVVTRAASDESSKGENSADLCES